MERARMATNNLAPNAIVTELLTESNYENWKVCLEGYLLSKDLWDIVAGTETQPESSRADEFRIWRKSNAKALLAIRISCGPQMFSCIKKYDLAKDAWEHLAHLHQEENEETESSSDAELDSTDQGMRKVDYAAYQSLCKALERGDWSSVRRFLRHHHDQDAINSIITEFGETALHIAAESGKVQVVKELVKSMSKEAFEIKTNNDQLTALFYVVKHGSREIAEAMVGKNPNLVCIKNKDDLLPVVVASINENKDMVRFLYRKTPMEELSRRKGKNGATLLTTAIIADMFDIAFDLLSRYKDLAAARDIYGQTAVYVLAGRPSAFPSACQYGILKQWIYSCIHVQESVAGEEGDVENPSEGSKAQVHKFTQVPSIKQLHDKKVIHNQALELLDIICSEVQSFDTSQLEKGLVNEAILVAAKFGSVEFIVQIIKSRPSLKFAVDRNNRAGKLAPSSHLGKVSGAALQMQRELQWFKAVEKVMDRKEKEEKNSNGETPQALFTEEHKDMLKEGGKWMKQTAHACMVVATLIATVMFAATFTVPGGNREGKGTPFFLKNRSFMVFIVSDALSLFSSCTAVLMFLAILTSHYGEDDFHSILPRRMLIGLVILFFSIATMMAAFGATLFIVLRERVAFVAIPVTLLSTIPITLFAWLQFPLLVKVFRSTFGSSIFRTPTKRMRY